MHDDDAHARKQRHHRRIVTLGSPRHIDSTADGAYVVFPVRLPPTTKEGRSAIIGWNYGARSAAAGCRAGEQVSGEQG